LLVIACLGVAAPVTAALAQGAGDQQYQDPFGDSGSGSGSSGAGSSGSSGSKTQTNQGGSVEPLSPSPQTSSGSSGSGTSGSGTAATPTTTPQASRSLPNTGLDTRVLLLGGAALLILGLGLRLRSAPERF
jgi:LPXTG-motif cell wall-anchored protein